MCDNTADDGVFTPKLVLKKAKFGFLWQTGGVKAVEKRQTKMQIQKALSEDPSIYQYDEVYDGMRDNISKAVPKQDEKKQSRYIQSLKRNAERRKLENERRTERQVQKEREEEGEQFKNKETFVTASYKKKLEEFQKLDEEEKRMDHLEEIGDVTKQNDLSGFYRHLYKSVVHEDTKNSISSEIRNDSDAKVILQNKGTDQKEDVKPVQNKNQQRQYRKRTKSSSSKEEGEKTSSMSSSSDNESGDGRKSKVVKPDIIEENKTSFVEKKVSRSMGNEDVENSTSSKKFNKEIENRKLENDFTFDNEVEIKKEPVTNKTALKTKLVSNIWSKRTIGSNLDEALLRYLQRKSKTPCF